MQQIIYFFIRNKNFLLFLLLFLVSIGFTINSHSYHKNKYITSANFFSGTIYNWKSSVTNYFGLREQNEALAEENLRLRTLLRKQQDTVVAKEIDSTILPAPFTYFPAKVINNSYSKTKNYLTLRKRASDNIEPDMGVISSKGIVGIVNNVSKKYASVQSILNTNSKINAKLKNSFHFGTLSWEPEDKNPNVVKLADIPRQAPVIVGDTIITGGKSTIFPRGVLIGTIKNFNLSTNQDYYDVSVELFNDMTSLNTVYIIKNNEKEAILQIENNDNRPTVVLDSINQPSPQNNAEQ
ncbi:rod shape-determining protein MreC [Marinirhabdus gelatinilytica]|uniref:Cell shape-determining protein MreC n=1 Tax=Marinirhabdus gelatinilytica TaxID=1703343 RepID=A0A370QLA4_9FLAO|nr:rod shape-determining protein MreC [Marinirhabdus gelatinilytica]RDK89101.1 rod shape-determining protein MreC [Marinirhabdus gelatinilytica]